jgi:CRP-like cAMP-binding protein
VDELFRISTIARQVRYQAKATVQERGAPAEYIQVLLEGQFRVENGEDAPRTVSPPAMLGLQEVLQGTALESSATAESDSVALVLSAEEFRTLLAANIELAQGLFRMLFQPSEDGESRDVASAASLQYVSREEPLKTVEKAMILQTIPIFSHATAEEIYEVAAVARELALDPKATLFAAGSPASIVMLLSGQIEVNGQGEPTCFGPGHCLGTQETFAAANWEKTASVIDGGRALSIEREALFDVLADRMDLLQGIFSAVFHREAGGSESLP